MIRLESATAATLVFSWGNPGRGDDALGPTFAEAVERWGLDGVDCLTDFQLQIEHALDLYGRSRVLFVDAALSGEAPFTVSPVTAIDDRTGNSHAMSPQALLHTLRRVAPTATAPQAWLLGIRGYRWEFGAPLSDPAREHLAAALDWARTWLTDPAEYTPPEPV